MTFRTQTLMAIVLLAASSVLHSTPAAAQTGGPYSFYPMTPCRAVDTRTGVGGYLGLLHNGETRSFSVKNSACAVPADARAVFVNMTIADPTRAGWSALFAAGSTWSGFSSINFTAVENISNGAIVELATGTPDLSALFAFAPTDGTANLIIDVSGFFK